MKEQVTGSVNVATTTIFRSASSATCAICQKSWAKRCWAYTVPSVFHIKRVIRIFYSSRPEVEALIWWIPSTRRIVLSMFISILILTRAFLASHKQPNRLPNKLSWLQHLAMRLTWACKKTCPLTKSQAFKLLQTLFSSAIRTARPYPSGGPACPKTDRQDSWKLKICDHIENWKMLEKDM